MKDANLSYIRINEARLKDDFDALAQIGGNPEGGVNRTTFSREHLAARGWFKERIESDGFGFHVDGAGNHSAILECGDQNALTLLLGSHLDSVPSGGRFDGALGVLAALETLRTIRELGCQIRCHLEAIDFTDEEGTFFPLLGSSAFAGQLTLDRLTDARGGIPALWTTLESAGLHAEGVVTARRDPRTLAGYLELHIEQGKKIETANANIGIVSQIVGIRSYQVNYIGRADHAGTAEMKTRLDAAQGGSEFILSVRQTLLIDYPDCVANVGRMTISPGAFNIVPESAKLALEIRAPTIEQLDKLENSLLRKAHESAEKHHLGVEIESLVDHLPRQMDPTMMDAIQGAASRLGLSHTTLASGAGHDAQSLAAICPAGMIFIPSLKGASHSAREFSTWQDCLNGVNVLLHTVLQLAQLE